MKEMVKYVDGVDEAYVRVIPLQEYGRVCAAEWDAYSGYLPIYMTAAQMREFALVLKQGADAMEGIVPDEA
jgi:hypothetical protein